MNAKNVRLPFPVCMYSHLTCVSVYVGSDKEESGTEARITKEEAVSQCSGGCLLSHPVAEAG